jgi:hypothetical protein
MPGATLNASAISTKQKCSYLLAHRNAANAATSTMTQDAHFKIVHETGSTKNMMQHGAGCKYMYLMVNCRQLYK